MTKRITAFTALLLAGSLVPSAQATTTHKSTSSSAHHTSASATHHTTASASHHTGASSGSSNTAHAGKKGKSKKLHGQQAIDPERVTQIQAALIKAHYLSGDADGNWDSHTLAAMQKFQADNNWQTKLMPDSRALMKLGLGPDYSDAINAKGASFTPAPVTPANTSAPQTSGFVDASGISR
jgi:hypothetical protein